MTWRRYHFLNDAMFLERLERLRLMGKRSVRGVSSGARRARRMGDSLEFADHRAYMPGDDPRFIDWPYYARMEKLLVRLFHEHSESSVAILLDASASMTAGNNSEKFDAARRLTATLAYVAMSGGDRVMVLPFSEQLIVDGQATRNRRHIFDVLDRLAELRPAGQTHLLKNVDEVIGRYAESQTVLLISDLLDCEDELPIALRHLLMAGRETTVLHLQSPVDASAPVSGQWLLNHAETHERLAVTVTPQLVRAYEANWRKFCDTCRHVCVAHGAAYAAIPTDVPADRLLLQMLRHAGILAG